MYIGKKSSPVKYIFEKKRVARDPAAPRPGPGPEPEIFKIQARS